MTERQLCPGATDTTTLLHVVFTTYSTTYPTRCGVLCKHSALLTSYEHAGAWSAAADDISATCHRRRPKIFLCPPIESSSRDSSITYIASPVSMRHSKSSYTYWIQFFKYKVFQKRRKHFSVHCVSKKRGVELFAITFINC